MVDTEGTAILSLGQGKLVGKNAESLPPAGKTAGDTEAVELKEWIATARRHGELTQVQLGEAMGLTKQNISGWENGRHEPSWSQMARISIITKFPLPAAGYAPRQAHTPYAAAVASLIDRLPEEERQTAATVAKAAIDQYIKDQRKAARSAKPASSSTPQPTPSPRKG